MTAHNTLDESLLEGLTALFDCENQLVNILPKVRIKASNGKLREILREQHGQTGRKIGRLRKLGRRPQVEMSGSDCKAMQGLVAELKDIIANRGSNDALIDVHISCAMNRIAHYKIASIGAALMMANELDQAEVVEHLEQFLNEEVRLNQELCELAQKELLAKASLIERMGSVYLGPDVYSRADQRL